MLHYGRGHTISVVNEISKVENIAIIMTYLHVVAFCICIHEAPVSELLSSPCCNLVLGMKFRLLILENKSCDECNGDRSDHSSPAVGQLLSYLEDESVYHCEEVHVHTFL